MEDKGCFLFKAYMVQRSQSYQLLPSLNLQLKQLKIFLDKHHCTPEETRAWLCQYIETFVTAQQII